MNGLFYSWQGRLSCSLQRFTDITFKRIFNINDLARIPHEKFINMAKEQGLKFTFGSDTRDIKTGRLDYCKNIAKKCNLKREDFFIPKRVLNT